MSGHESSDAAVSPGAPGSHPMAERFDRWAGGYEASDLQTAYYGPLHREALQMALRAVPDARRILDVGCGTARLLRDTARLFPDADFVGVDLAQRMLTHGRALAADYPRISFVRARAERLPFPDDAFDLTLCICASHHFDDPRAAFDDIRRLTRRDGAFVLAHLLDTDNHDAFRGQCRDGRRVRAQASRITQHLRHAGFITIESTLTATCPVMPVTLLTAVRRAPG